MNIIKKSLFILAAACEGSPIATTIVTAFFYLGFNFLLAMVEKLIFGERFIHWLDPIIAIVFMGYSASAVFYCAVFNSESKS